MCAPSVDASLSLVIGCMGAPSVDEQFLVHKVLHMPYAYIRLCKSVCGGGALFADFCCCCTVVVNYCGDRVAVPLLGPPRPGNWRESPPSGTSLER